MIVGEGANLQRLDSFCQGVVSCCCEELAAHPLAPILVKDVGVSDYDCLRQVQNGVRSRRFRHDEAHDLTPDHCHPGRLLAAYPSL